MRTKIRISATPVTTERGICLALRDVGHNLFHSLFRDYLDEVAQLDPVYPVQQLTRRKRNHRTYVEDCQTPGHWDLSTRQGRARLTLWGAFLHWLETNHGDKFEVVP